MPQMKNPLSGLDRSNHIRLGRDLVVTHNTRSPSGCFSRELSAPEHPVQGVPAPPDGDPPGLAVALAAQVAAQPGQAADEVTNRPVSVVPKLVDTPKG